MTIDYGIIDPGPDDPASADKSYWALNTMVSHNREGLLVHPVCQTLLSQKWRRFGQPIFYLNLFLYASYLASFTALLLHYANIQDHCCDLGRHYWKKALEPDLYGTKAVSYFHYLVVFGGILKENATAPTICMVKSSDYNLYAGLHYIVAIVFLLRELFKMYAQVRLLIKLLLLKFCFLPLSRKCATSTTSSTCWPGC